MNRIGVFLFLFFLLLTLACRPSRVMDESPIVLPVAVSYVKNQWADNTKIITVGLNNNYTYAQIPVENGTILKSSVAIDDESNVYLTYGTNKTFFAKLGIDGSAKYIELPVAWNFDSVWIGERLIINSSGLIVVGTDFSVEELPAIDKMADGSSAVGFLGLANSDKLEILWVASLPIREDGKLLAFYRTLDLTNMGTTEGKLEIPFATENWGLTHYPEDRLGSIVYGVDTDTENVLLCYGKGTSDNTIATFLELYNTKDAKIIMSEKRCCLNSIIKTSGDVFLSNILPETCSFQMVPRYSDGLGVIDFSGYDDSGPQNWRWSGSNGSYLYVMTLDNLYILDHDGFQLFEHAMPEGNFRKCYPPNCISPALLIVED